MNEILKRCGIVLSPIQLDRLWTYHNLLRRYNPELNLTRIHNFENMVLKLYVDSILPGQMVDLPSPLLDLGTGPGMPGIPLRISYPNLEVILAESRGKRVEFLEMTVDKLGIANISVVGHSITPRFETPVRAVITRAVEEIADTLERISGCLASGGLAIFMKGPDCESEITVAQQKFAKQYRLQQNTGYQIPHTSNERRLVIFERIDAPIQEQRTAAMTIHPYSEIESDQNAFFKDLKKLLTGRGIKKSHTALISGQKQVAEVLKNFPQRCTAWISAPDQPPPPSDAPEHLKWYQLAFPLFKAIDVIGTDAPMLLVKMPPVNKWAPADGLPDGCSVMIPFQDPENVGTVIRSAVAFGIENILLLSESAHPYHPKAFRASGGAVLYANLFEGPSVKLLTSDLPVVPLSAEGKDIVEFSFPDTFAFLPGIEGPGLPKHFREQSLSIPISKEVESLNAATAAAIAFYIWSQARKHIKAEKLKE